MCAAHAKSGRLLCPVPYLKLQYSSRRAAPCYRKPYHFVPVTPRHTRCSSIDFRLNPQHLGVVSSNSNEVEIPIGGVEDALVQCAVPGFWGHLTIEVRLQKTAALEVELHQEKRTITQTDTDRDTICVVPSNERVTKVRSRMGEVQEKLRLHCPVTSIRGMFKDGHLVSLEITEREQIEPIPFPATGNTKVIR